MSIGENIKRVRKEKNMTQKQLAEKSGLAVITIQQYEAGKYEPKNLSLKKLVAALECDISDLIDVYAIDELESDRERQIEEEFRPILEQLGYKVRGCTLNGTEKNLIIKFEVEKDGKTQLISSKTLYDIKKQTENSLLEAQRALFIVKVGEALKGSGATEE